MYGASPSAQKRRRPRIDIGRRCTVAAGLFGLLLQAISPTLADGIDPPIEPLSSIGGTMAHSGAAPAQTWKVPDAYAIGSWNNGNDWGAAAGASTSTWSSRDESGNRFDPLPLAVGVIILGAIALAILNASDSSSIAGD